MICSDYCKKSYTIGTLVDVVATVVACEVVVVFATVVDSVEGLLIVEVGATASVVNLVVFTASVSAVLV
ncbi:hypothetical protein OZD68_06135 [Wolbachia endosymbiont of Drosophila bicornuta]|uniref:hypothetical protein n=1 Tax=Wolbachia endosymbiont of Drosophila bicornuta TaxID=375918 RepID=UPI0015F9697B|nr:hypothetical protein [Wolbachia endosymbiont of Drosophila bicornuta]MBA8754843.1 hypothetical protein [Wolbachia pipientis]MDE5057128.1 hypothetical protein [Wolbachia endosymbiont of Drosophila bicornuta]